MSLTLAVLTGDLIRSTDVPVARLEHALVDLKTAADEIARFRTGPDDAPVGPTHFTRHRGDGWQICLARPRLATRAALYLRAVLRSVPNTLDSRISIAEGQGSVPPDGNLNSASGPAFVRSGRGLDALTGPQTFVTAEKGGQAAALLLADHLSRRWTPAQARAVRLKLGLPGLTSAEVAKHLGVSRQAVDQALAAASFPVLDAALDLIEHSDRQAE